MLSFKSRRRGAVQSKRFVPEGVNEQAGARLESRALTAPAFWRQPVPVGSHLGASATVAGRLGTVPYLDDNSDMYNTEAALSLTLDTPPPDLPASVTFSGYATANINDIAQTFAPDAPVGSDTISGNTTARWELSRSGDTHSLWPIGNPLVESAAGRDYVLADDSSTPAATTFVANASINLIGNTNAVSPSTPTYNLLIQTSQLSQTALVYMDSRESSSMEIR